MLACSGAASAYGVNAPARDHARTLLVLDTAIEGGAAAALESSAAAPLADSPDYAPKPQGGRTGTRIHDENM